MAKKRRRRKTSLITKGINWLTLGIALSPLINALLSGGDVGQRIVRGYSAGLVDGSFDKARAIQWYGPLVGAIAFRKAVSMLRKTAHV